MALPTTSGADKAAIRAALANLAAGGSTNGGAGITRAYALARASFLTGGVNRVILCTDGDFNVGTTSEGELTRLIEDERKHGVYLSVLGFGRGMADREDTDETAIMDGRCSEVGINPFPSPDFQGFCFLASRHESGESVRHLRTYGDHAARKEVSRRSGLRSGLSVGVQM